MIVRFTPNALADLDSILDFVTEQSPSGAHRIRQRIRSLIDLLPSFPHAGQRTDVEELRRLLATPFPYAIFYRCESEEIVIVGVRHTARDSDTLP